MSHCEKCGALARFSVTCRAGCTHHGCARCITTEAWQIHTTAKEGQS